MSETAMLSGDQAAQRRLRDLTPLLRPGSLVVVGASQSPRSLSARVFRLAQSIGTQMRIVGVNPRHPGRLHGVEVVPSIEDLAFTPDAAVITIPADMVPGALASLARIGTHNAVVISSGFAEVAGGGELSDLLAETARRYDMNVSGPNCIGHVNLTTRGTTSIGTFFETEPVRPGSVAVVGQSGGIAGLTYSLGVGEGLGFSHIISSGNEVDLDTVDYLDYLVGDEHTDIVCVYLENLRRGRELVRVADAFRLAGKRLILLKGGRTASGAKASESHTGAMATDFAVFASMMRRSHAVVVRSLPEMVACAVMCSGHGQGRSFSAPGIGVLANSGGTSVLAGDMAGDRGVELADFSPQTLDSLRQHLPGFINAGNPVDMTPQLFSDPARLPPVWEAIVADDNCGTACVISSLRTGLSERMAEAIAPVMAASAKPAFAVWLGASPVILQTFRQHGVPVLADCGTAFDALSALVTADTADLVTRPAAGSTWPADGQPRLVTEDRLADALRQAGIPVAAGRTARTEQEAESIAQEAGHPVAVKVISPVLAHRAAVGAVELDVTGPGAAARAFRQIAATMTDLGLADEFDGCYIQPMVASTAELFLGLKTDRAFGPVITLGPGGTSVERAGTLVIGLATPGQAQDDRFYDLADQILPDLSAGSRLELRRLIDQVCKWFVSGSGLAEIDLNPVMVTHDGLIVVDCLGVAI